MRMLIVNADDFGLCHGVNAGIMAAHDHGVVTSASLMVRQPAAEEAVALAAARPGLSLGLHVDLAEWIPTAEHDWSLRYAHCDIDDTAAVWTEIEHQLERFHALVGQSPSHLDAHQHVQRDEPVAAAMRFAARDLDVPLRLHDDGVHYRGDFYGQDARGRAYPEGITVDRLLDIVRTLPEGCTELACHPGLGVSGEESTYAPERATEVAALCDARVEAARLAAGVVLASFTDLAARRDGRAH
ncbi:MAG TPA: ChbG/HpnK family deacetylase [Acidimicrobiales bacterium]|jgi:predicted glycoside hydrolase/deacetylase ChbG (UPF0249 family)|nr:ChbG/HpnK family deacetylase [Acidimicrobiales bacterium]